MGQSQQKDNTTKAATTAHFASDELTSPNSAHNHGDDFSKILANNFSERSPITPKKGFDPFDFCDHEGFNWAKQGNWTRVENMLKTKKATLQDIDRHGNTMLYYSCLAGHPQLAKSLLDRGARDDKFARCYLNSLSQELRCLLKRYHNYSFATKKKAEEDENVVTEDNSLITLLLSYVKRAIFSNEEENHDNPDMTLTIHFSGEQSPAVYRLHKFILISRWPEIIEFILNENPIQKSDLVQLEYPTMLAYDLDPREYNSQVISLFSPFNNRPTLEKLGVSVRQAKEYIKEKFPSYQLPNLNDQQIEHVYERLTDINLGMAPFSRKVFEVILAYIYTGRIIDPRVKSTFIPVEKIITKGGSIPFINELIDAAYSLKLTELAKILFVEVGIHSEFISRKFKVKSNLDMFQEARKKQLQQQLSPLGFCLESKQPTNILDSLRRKGCDMKIKLAETLEDEEGNVSTLEQSDVILCHKSFVTKRSPYFDIITSCSFSEGLQFREEEEEERNGIATLELNCPNMEILTQLINYTYCESANITASICIELSIQAQKLDYTFLYIDCENFMIENLTIDDADMFELYKLATFLGSEKLKKFWRPQTIKYVANLIRNRQFTMDMVEETLLNDLECDENECKTLLSQIQEKVDFN